MTRALSFLLCVAGLVILAQFWVFMVISEWIVDDSYAVIAFHKAHPVLDFFVELTWNFETFGGRYVLAFLALVLVLFLVQSLRTKRVYAKPA
jgi:hypothetical protein